jgi:heptosyltransferase-2
MSLRSALIPWLGRIPVRIGWDESAAGRFFYTRRVPYRRDRHHAERCWRLAFPDGEPATPMPAPSLQPGYAEHTAVSRLLQHWDAGDERPLVALAPGSVWATKRWPYFAQLAAELAAEARLVVVGGPTDTPMAEAIVAGAPSARVLDATGQLSLLASAELIGRAAVLVTNDSSPLHRGSAMGTPTVAIFGPTVPAFGFGPLAPRSVVVEHAAMPCRPCHHHGPPTCPLVHFKCMKELGAERVAVRVREVLASCDAAAADSDQ